MVTEKSSNSSKKQSKQLYSDKYENLELVHKSENTEAYTLKDTPFTIHRTQYEWHIICGTWRMNEYPHETIEQAITDALQITWNRIVATIGIITDAKIKEMKATL